MTLIERLKQEAALTWYGQRACLPALLHEAAKELDDMRALLADVDRELGIDGHGAPFEDGECAVIDRVRLFLSRSGSPE